MTAAAFLGLDLGTSGLKAIAINETGQVLCRAQAGYPTARPEPGAAEQDPADWQAALSTCVRRLGRELSDGGYRVQSLGLSAMLPTLVTAAADGTPNGPALTWQDARAEEVGERLRDVCGAQRLYRRTGQWLDGRYLLPMYLRLAAAEPERGSSAYLLGAKDWLLQWLTGAAATDPSTATGFGCYQLEEGNFDLDLLAAAGGEDVPSLPEVLTAEQPVPLRAEVAAELGLTGPVSVHVGGADSVLGALGLGVTSPGSVAYVAGTSTVVLGISAGWSPDPAHRYLVTPLAGAAGWGYEMDLLATGAAFRWLCELLGRPDEADLLRLAAQVHPAAAPIVLPYLAPGEQGALWNPRLRGAITGLGLSDGPAELGRGLANGILLESRRCIQVLGGHGMLGPIHVAGGSSVDAGFCGDLADATGRTVLAPRDQHTDHSALGAALLAAGAAGCEPTPAREQVAHQPRAERAGLWDDLAERHDAIRLALHPDGTAGPKNPQNAP